MRIAPVTAVLLAVCACAAGAAPAAAQTIAYEHLDLEADLAGPGGERVMLLSVGAAQPAEAPIPKGIGTYGPFRVVDAAHAALVDVTDARSPAAFAAMLRDHPAIAEIDMIDCPGTEDDLANLQLGRLIRQHRIAMHVPAGGSVRSGGVELFLAGAQRSADPGAEFAVHSWMDDEGRQPRDFSASAPENVRYTDYYRQMGMSPIEAQAFYAMTNSVSFDSAKWFGAAQMGLWVRLDRSKV